MKYVIIWCVKPFVKLRFYCHLTKKKNSFFSITAVNNFAGSIFFRIFAVA